MVEPLDGTVGPQYESPQQNDLIYRKTYIIYYIKKVSCPPPLLHNKTMDLIYLSDTLGLATRYDSD